MSEAVPVAVIGGTGVYNIDGLENITEVEVDTPFGKPSDAIRVGTFGNLRVAFLARHGRKHNFSPSEVPYRANVYALKSLGVKYILSVSVVGSLREEVKPLDVVMVDQFIDLTKKRETTFFEKGIVAHVGFSDPVCPNMKKIVTEAVKDSVSGIDVHESGTYVCMEGPAFSSKAESNMYRVLGGTLIGMTGATEAKLVREAEIAFSMVAVVTDYDCWHPDHDSVTVDMVMKNLKLCAENSQKMVYESLVKLSKMLPESDAHSALKFSILSKPEEVSEETKERLKHIIKKYV